MTMLLRTIGTAPRMNRNFPPTRSLKKPKRGGGGSQSQNVVQNAGPAPSSENGTAPGQISVRARVTVTFDLR